MLLIFLFYIGKRCVEKLIKVLNQSFLLAHFSLFPRFPTPPSSHLDFRYAKWSLQFLTFFFFSFFFLAFFLLLLLSHFQSMFHHFSFLSFHDTPCSLITHCACYQTSPSLSTVYKKEEEKEKMFIPQILLDSETLMNPEN